MCFRKRGVPSGKGGFPGGNYDEASFSNKTKICDFYNFWNAMEGYLFFNMSVYKRFCRY